MRSLILAAFLLCSASYIQAQIGETSMYQQAFDSVMRRSDIRKFLDSKDCLRTHTPREFTVQVFDSIIALSSIHAFSDDLLPLHPDWKMIRRRKKQDSLVGALEMYARSRRSRDSSSFFPAARLITPRNSAGYMLFFSDVVDSLIPGKRTIHGSIFPIIPQFWDNPVKNIKFIRYGCGVELLFVFNREGSLERVLTSPGVYN